MRILIVLWLLNRWEVTRSVLVSRLRHRVERVGVLEGFLRATLSGLVSRRARAQHLVLLLLIVLPCRRRLVRVDVGHSCSGGLRSRARHDSAVHRRSHFFSHSVGETGHLEGHVRIICCVVWLYSSWISEQLAAVYHQVLVIFVRLLGVDGGLLGREPAPHWEFRGVWSLLDMDVRLLELAVSQSHIRWPIHPIGAKRPVWRRIVRLHARLSGIVRCELARRGGRTLVVVRIQVRLELQLVSEREKFALNHFPFLLLGFEGHFEVISVSLDENEFLASVLQLVSDLNQGSLSLEGHIGPSPLNRLVLLQLELEFA